MEILINIPSYLHPMIERILQYWSYLITIWTYLQESMIYIYHSMTASFLYVSQKILPWPFGTSIDSSSSNTTTAITTATSTLSSYTSNVIVPIVAIVFVFWPILLSIIMAVVTAWAWIFWLFTSILLGLLQVGYATYQFFMITMDICGISILKTYVVVVRNRFLYLFDTKQSHQTSRRKIWWQRLEQARNYEEFLKIRIESKQDVYNNKNRNKSNSSSSNGVGQGRPRNSRIDGSPSIWSTFFRSRAGTMDHTNDHEVDDDGAPHDTALPPRIIGRSNSFTSSRSMETQPLSPSKIVMLRNLSFSGTVPNDSSHNGGNSYHPSGSNHTTTTVQCRNAMAIQELGQQTADLLVSTTYRLEQSRLACMDNPENNAAPISTMQYLLAGVVKRNHLQLDELLVQNARSIAEMGYYGLSKHTRHIIKSYYQELEKCLDYIADAPVVQQQPLPPQSSSSTPGFSIFTDHHRLLPHGDLFDRITLLRKMKQNIGRTALMLSGGGAQAMYHLGVIKALIESKLYDDIKVISGTSGGSITAAMCAIKTADELYNDVCVNTVSTDFMLTGEMKKHNIRWFPPMYDMATYWIKHKLLVDSAYFGRTCEFYFKDYTFEEAFIRTGKHVCITVSASRASGNTAQRLLLNHISTPHVTIASAVRASCALPGVMAPAKLVVKSSSGVLEPFEVDGVEWIDGSVQADLPFQRIATLFAITSFIVSQTNFHVVPFLNKEHHPDNKSLYWKLFQTIEWDIRSRALKLSRLGLFPRIFGQDVSKVFKQKYHGNLTIVPRFTTMQTFGLKALSNPTVKDMDGYLKYSQIATWPYLNAIRDMIRLEKALDDCLARLEGRIRSMNPESDWSTHDEIESIESSSVIASSSIHRVRIIGRPAPQPNGSIARDRDAERLRRKVSGLERENQLLREELEKLQRYTDISPSMDDTDQQVDPDCIDTDKITLLDGSEGEVWNLVRSAGTSTSMSTK